MSNEPTDRAEPMQGLAERIAVLLWAGFSTTPQWTDEPHKEDYRDIAKAVLAEVEASRQRPAAQAVSAEPQPDDYEQEMADRAGIATPTGERPAAPAQPVGADLMAEYFGLVRALVKFIPDGAIEALGPMDRLTNFVRRLSAPAQAAAAIPIGVLREHWLHAMECDHDTKQDKPHCACSRVDLGWHPSVGAAVEAWLEHVLVAASPAAAAGVPTEEPLADASQAEVDARGYVTEAQRGQWERQGRDFAVRYPFKLRRLHIGEQIKAGDWCWDARCQQPVMAQIGWVGVCMTAQHHPHFRIESASPVAPAGVPTDEQILHLWDTHVGEPTARHPLTKRDKLRFARAVLSAGAPAVPMQDSSSVHLADNGSSPALRAASQETPLSLVEVNDLAKVYASSYASPHHITFTVDGLRSLLEAVGQSPLWISVDERMPEDGTECIVWSRGNAQHGPYAYLDTWREQHEAPVSFSSVTVPIGLGWDSSDFDSITHWMPLPRPPVQCDGHGAPTGQDVPSEAAKLIASNEQDGNEISAAGMAQDAARTFNDGIEAAAALLDKKADAYDAEHGATDLETGTREYPGRGAGEDYYNTLRELPDDIRALRAVPHQPTGERE